MSDSKPTPAEAFPLGFAIAQLARLQRAQTAARLRPLGLFPGQELILWSLRQRSPRPQIELARELRVERSSIAKSLYLLECADLVDRPPSDLDGRVNAVVLTRVGQEKSEPLEAVLREVEATLSRALSVTQQRALLDLIAARRH